MPEPIETAETPANADAGVVTDVETVETEANVEKPLDEMTPEELRAYAEKVVAERDDWRGHSRKHEDAKKAAAAQAKKLEEQLNSQKPVEQVNADKIAALEAQILETKKESAILKLAKDKKIPDEALPFLYAASLDDLETVADNVLALVAKVSATKGNTPALPINRDQGTETKVGALNGADLELYNLLHGKK